MTLNKQDIQYLIDCGYLESDISQIKRAKKVLSSLGRCAFHWTACNENNKSIIYFDARKLFEE